MTTLAGKIQQRATHLDVQACRTVNGLLRHRVVHVFFAVVSRMGDGALWYALILSLPVFYGLVGVKLSILMLVVGLLNVSLYKRIKLRLARPRPFALYPFITKGAHVLDEYSFPSGHTLHAVTFSIIMVNFAPATAVFLVPFAVATGLSRVVLGVHFPSDVLFGAAIGLLNGWLAVSVMHLLVV